MPPPTVRAVGLVFSGIPVSLAAYFISVFLCVKLFFRVHRSASTVGSVASGKPAARPAPLRLDVILEPLTAHTALCCTISSPPSSRYPPPKRRKSAALALTSSHRPSRMPYNRRSHPAPYLDTPLYPAIEAPATPILWALPQHNTAPSSDPSASGSLIVPRTRSPCFRNRFTATPSTVSKTLA